jgi:hypothetical protein
MVFDVIFCTCDVNFLGLLASTQTGTHLRQQTMSPPGKAYKAGIRNVKDVRLPDVATSDSLRDRICWQLKGKSRDADPQARVRQFFVPTGAAVSTPWLTFVSLLEQLVAAEPCRSDAA